ncbi:MAG TPA: hypothetical protein VFL19_01370 [Nitrospira sp.]|nr:hypothetical protein [Nitrospira sp.]
MRVHLPAVPGRGRHLWAFVALALCSLAGCGLFSSRDGAHIGYYLPLTVHLRQAPSVAAAQLTYQDACGRNQVLPFGQQLTEAIKRKSGLVFEKVVTESAPTSASIDGYEDVSVGLVNLDLFIPRQATRSHPATLAIGLDFTYTGADGNVLFSKKLQSVGSGDVDINVSSCEVKGLDKIVKEAIANVTDGMAEQLGTSPKIRQAAAAGHTGGSAAVATVPPPSLVAEPAPAIPVPAPVPVLSPASDAAVSEEQPSTLMFRAIIRDENRNQLLHEGETMSVEIEVKNEGPGVAAGVEVLVSGAPALVETLPVVLPLGDISAGEAKRVSVTGKVGAVPEATQAELVLSLRAPSPAVQLPSVKKYLLAVKPANAPEAAALPVDVDEVPKPSAKFKQPKAVGIAIGIGQFRETTLPRVKYAQQDADTIAKYWNAVGGIPAERIRRLFDSRALKGDLVEVFEEWLPQQAEPMTVVYVFIAGRGVVDPATGAVSVIPFDGTAGSAARLYSLRRLQESLNKLPVQRAIVMVDLSLEHLPVQNGAAPAAPTWPQEQQGKERVMWMVGNREVQDSHHFDLGHHGLFAYQLLKGLGGEGDVDKDGIILAGELCTYARGQVAKMAREQFANEQDPLCVPGPGQGAMVRLQTVAKVR